MTEKDKILAILKKTNNDPGQRDKLLTELAAKYGDGFIPPMDDDIKRDYQSACAAISKAEGK